MEVLNVSTQEWVLNEEEWLKRLLCPEILETVPLINSNEVQNFKDGTLVRFRGMIQDMYGPGFYLEHFDVINDLTNERTTRNGKYNDGAISEQGEKVDFNSSVNRTSERHCFVAVSIPGLNAWVEQYECQKYRLPTKVEESRGTTSQKKRNYDEVMEDDVTGVVETTSAPKKTPNDDSTKADQKNVLTVSREHILNHPLGQENAKICHLYVYKDFEVLKLNDVCEFVGFLSVNPVVDALFHNEDSDFENQMEVETHHPPGSLVPRIHVVHFKNLQHNNPLVEGLLSENTTELGNVKKELLIVLTQLLLGDTLAAEYLICHLISEIYMRRDFMPLGKFSLNISNIPKLENVDYVARIYEFLEMLVTKSHYLPLTLENINSLPFTPKKDYECNRLTSGILQLSKNTMLVLDELKLQEGKLETVGVQSVRSIANAIKHQKVSYDFKYYPIEYECDIRFLIFSEGKSILPADVHIPLKPDQICLNTFSEILEAARQFLRLELLEEIRKYLTGALLIKYEITDEVQDLVQQEFVNMRQSGGIASEDLHDLLVLARLISLSEGKTSMDAGCWRKACEMEKQRKARLSKK